MAEVGSSSSRKRGCKIRETDHGHALLLPTGKLRRQSVRAEIPSSPAVPGDRPAVHLVIQAGRGVCFKARERPGFPHRAAERPGLLMDVLDLTAESFGLERFHVPPGQTDAPCEGCNRQPGPSASVVFPVPLRPNITVSPGGPKRRFTPDRRGRSPDLQAEILQLQAGGFRGSSGHKSPFRRQFTNKARPPAKSPESEGKISENICNKSSHRAQITHSRRCPWGP